MSPAERTQRAMQFALNAQRWAVYEQRVARYEAEGMSRSDAQGVVDAEDLKAERAAS